ncbi:MAG: hypothetical protein HYW01_00515 [Deltaproteobacteria bacterium]|nr:hypothetical protein [Deltaproteobacteria bacterium]
MRSKTGVIIFVAVLFLLFANRSAFACKGSQVLLEDNFSTLDPAWGEKSANLSVSSGKLIVQPEVNSSYVLLNQGNIFEDIDACVKLTQVKSDDPTYSAGLIFWAKDTSDYYYFLVTSDGWYSVKRWVNQRSLAPVDWRKSPAIKNGLGQTNHLRVVTKGNKATVYVNDTELITFSGQPPQGGSFVGMIAFSPEKATNKNVWEFSELKVTKPEPGPVTQPEVTPQPGPVTQPEVTQPDANKGGEVLQADNFTTLDPGWGEAGPNLSAANGKLTLQADVNAGFVALNQANRFEDIDAGINVSMAKSEDQSWGGGLVFWATDYDNYYALLVSGDGQFSIRRYVNARSMAPVDWRESSALKEGIGQVNYLRVVTKGNQVTVYINGSEVVTFNSQPPQGGGFIGVKGSSAEKSQIIWEFSELKVTKPSSSDFPG